MSPGERLSDALEALVARFGTMVRTIGHRHRLDEADIDAVLQEVRIRLWRACPSSEQIERLGASYVYRTATSAALDIMRRRRAYAADLADSVDDPSQPLPSDVRTPAQDLEASELAERVLAAVDALAPARRPVVRMYLTGYDREEIAELLGWSEAKVRNLLYRGLADLRQRLMEAGITLESLE